MHGQKTLSMFHYENLPPSMPQNELENILQHFYILFAASNKEKASQIPGNLPYKALKAVLDRSERGLKKRLCNI